MNVSDVMCKEPRAVRMVDTLDAAAQVLWDRDCGFVPVTDGADVLVGVLTDRDLCMASYTQGKPLAEVPVLVAMARELTTCGPDDDLKDAMKVMATARVHRLPVIDERGVLCGVLSSNDLVHASLARPAALAQKAVMETLAAIKEPRDGVRSFGATSTRKARAAKATASKGASSKRTTRKASAGKASAGKSSTGRSSSKARTSKARPAKARSSKGKA
jgi:CBS domain-containing protein